MRPPRRLSVPIAFLLTLGAVAGATTTTAASVTLVVPWGFSPNHDGRRDRATITVVTDGDATVSAHILTSRGTSVRTLAEDEPIAGEVTFVWRGRDDAGRRVRDARYRVVASVEGQSTTMERAPIVVDTTPPSFAWREIAPEPLRTTGPVRFTFVTRDRFSDRVAVGYVVRDVEDRGIERARPGTRPTGDVTLAWDARAPGSRPVAPGLYRVEISTRDALGNVRTGRSMPFRNHRPVNSSVVRRVDGAGRRVALTFDDCGSNDAWGKILDTLEASRSQATFFCVGTVLATSTPLARRTVRLGNAVGAHGWDHDSVVGVSESVIRSKVRHDQAAWWRRARTTPAPFFRPPSGELGTTTLAGVGAEGFRWTVLWDVDPADWTGIAPGTIRRRVLSSVRPGSIVVMHVTSRTAAALPGIVRGLRAKRLEAVALRTLLRAAGSR
jgi:peptidoglycan/xylan/chitin deacetylase (PgdA/CDA1 family)